MSGPGFKELVLLVQFPYMESGGAAQAIPGARICPATWTDKDGFLWLFGGLNAGIIFYNDLWRYDPDPASLTYNQWTWMNGSNFPAQPTVYGIINVPGILNTPGARAETNASWTDNNGKLWLYSGPNLTVCHNDLWRYDPDL